MAEKAAHYKRASCEEKLNSSIRQLKRYIEKPDQALARVLQQKIDKVDVDREELVASHHSFCEKSNSDITEQVNRDYIDPKVDAAVDLVDEAEALMETLTTQKETEERTRTDNAKKESELSTFRLKSESQLEVLESALASLTLHIANEEPNLSNADFAEATARDIKEREEELLDSWRQVRSLLAVQTDVDAVTVKEAKIRGLVYDGCSKAQLFISKARAQSVSDDTASTTSSASSTHHQSSTKLEKMQPPKFSGNIRDYARFKANYEAIVKPSYEDELHQMYILKEKCLTNEAHELVKNIDNLDDIWDRLAARYGDNIQIVDAVNKDIQNCTINGQNVHKGLIDFVNVLEKGVQDLESIKMEKEISHAYTVRLIEKKLPQRVYLKWLDEKHEEDGALRFVQLYKFLKEERKRVEKVLMQRDPVVEKERKKGGGIATATGGYNAGTPPPPPNHLSSQKNCLIHANGQHHTRKCRKFTSMSVDERGKLVKDLNACTLCLSTSHLGVSECPLKAGWQPCDVSGCGKYHSRLLHGCTIQG